MSDTKNNNPGAFPGKFIAIEGVDGAGKGVQSRVLRDALLAEGIDVLLTREPGGSPGAEEIRQLLVKGDIDKWGAIEELLLIYAARRSHLTQTIWPALEQGRWVISDRFADSSRAFQGFAGGLGLPAVDAIHNFVVGSFAPDVTFVLDLAPEVSLARAHARGGKEDRFEKKGAAYQQKVREGFLYIAKHNPHTHVVIDASNPISEVSQQMLRHVAERFALSELPSP
jgi:dTMP kinase